MNSIDLKRKFLKKDNLLILHLTDRCNNRCNFCMVKGGHGSFSFPYNEALKLIDTLPAHSKVDLFGGEPTLYPCFFDLLKYIKSQDMKCSIATNGRLFSKKEFIESVAQITGNDLYVRTSLYGLAALSHDRITGARNSFSELMLGIKNIVSLQMPCQVNIVLTKLNLPDLVGMTQLVIDKGVKRIKFGLIVNSRSCINLVPSLSEISPQLLKSIELAKKNNLKVTIEKAPLCLMPDYIHEFSSERELGEWPRYFDDQGECSSCIVQGGAMDLILNTLKRLVPVG